VTDATGPARAALDALRAADGEGRVTDGVALVPGVWMSVDREQGVTEGSYATRPGHILDLRLHVVEKGRWLTLNVATGTTDLAGLRLIGIYARARAPRALTVRAVLRVGLGDGFEDVPFAREIVAFPETSAHVDVIHLDRAPVLRAEPRWRNLVLWFPTGSFACEIEDLRLFAA